MNPMDRADALCMIFFEEAKETVDVNAFLAWCRMTEQIAESAIRFFGEGLECSADTAGLLTIWINEQKAADGPAMADLIRRFLKLSLPEEYTCSVLYSDGRIPYCQRVEMVRNGVYQYEHTRIQPGRIEKIREVERSTMFGSNEEIIRARMRSFAEYLEKGDFDPSRVFFSQLHMAFRYGNGGIHPRGLYTAAMTVLILQYSRFTDEMAESLARHIPSAILGETWYRFVLNQIHAICLSRSQEPRSRFEPFEQKVHRLIDFEVTNPKLDLKMAADFFDLTPTYFSQQFKQIIGVGFLSYVEQKRMDIGHDLLKQRDMSVEKAAHACGYENVGSFRRNFKKHFGINPGDMKR